MQELTPPQEGQCHHTWTTLSMHRSSLSVTQLRQRCCSLHFSLVEFLTGFLAAWLSSIT